MCVLSLLWLCETSHDAINVTIISRAEQSTLSSGRESVTIINQTNDYNVLILDKSMYDMDHTFTIHTPYVDFMYYLHVCSKFVWCSRA